MVPQKYYDRFPPDEVKLPPYPTTNDWKEWRDRIKEDLEDVPEYAIRKIARPDKEYAEVIELGKWETSIQSYLAAIVSCMLYMLEISMRTIQFSLRYTNSDTCSFTFFLHFSTGLLGYEHWPTGRCL